MKNSIAHLSKTLPLILSLLLAFSVPSKANASHDNFDEVVVGSLIGLAVGLAINDNSHHTINTHQTHVNTRYRNIHYQHPRQHTSRRHHRHHSRHERHRNRHHRHHNDRRHRHHNDRHHVREVHKLPQQQVTRRVIIEERQGRRVNLNNDNRKHNWRDEREQRVRHYRQ